MAKSEKGRVIRGVKDVNIRKTSEKGAFAVAFALEGENFAIAINERMGVKLMLQLVAVLGSKTKGKAKAARIAPDRDTAILPDAVQLISEDDGSAVLMLEMNGIEVPIRLEAEQLEQFEPLIEAHKPVELDVDEMTARKPNALETDKRFFFE